MENNMAAYMLAVCKITNMKPEMKEYAEKSGALCIAHGGKYLIRGMAKEDYEGDLLEGKLVILTEFPTMDDLQTFIKGDEYQNNIKHLREGTGEYHIAFYESPPGATD
jgi:uncharacterized protein (DUF1330 family)